MRPVSLQLEGFSSFAEPTEISFRDAEQFVLFGPTGSGKSSVLDAMAFGLYGSVPRYADKKLVWPVITQGKVEARIQFDFTLSGRSFTAVRVVKRLGEGGTTKAARLESNGECLADGADEVSKAATEHLGLDFDQFTKTVLLPQGEFAKFLHDTGKSRNELLKRLLEVERFEKIKTKADDRYRTASNEKVWLDGKLDNLKDATEAEAKQLSKRVEELAKLKREVDEQWPAIENRKAKSADEELKAKDAEARAHDLDAIKRPEGLDELSARLENAAKSEADASNALEKANKDLKESQLLLDALPKQIDLERLSSAYAAREKLAGEKQIAGDALVEAMETTANAEISVKAAANKVEEAEEELIAIQHANAAHAIALTLRPGDKCPVCGNTVQLIGLAGSGDIEEAAALVKNAKSDAVAAAGALRSAELELAKAKERADSLESRLRETESVLKEAPPLRDVEDRLRQVVTQTIACREAGEQSRTAMHQWQSAQQELKQAKESIDRAHRTLADKREGFFDLKPPSIEGKDIGTDWAVFEAWAKSRAESIAAEAQTLRLSARASAEEANRLELELKSKLSEHGMVCADLSPKDACLKELTSAEDSLKNLKARIEEAIKLRQDLKEVTRRALLFSDLKKHLDARHFEKWYLNRTFGLLCQIASEHLGRLTNDRYSLCVTKDNEFEIEDRANANEHRPIRTLSGGETFLASLSLALALSDQIAGSRAKLESLFIDEGFGSLDPETLEVVSAAISDLGAKGRMIGVITHVQSLADTFPVRFKVSRGPNGSIIEKEVA